MGGQWRSGKGASLSRGIVGCNCVQVDIDNATLIENLKSYVRCTKANPQPETDAAGVTKQSDDLIHIALKVY